MSSLGHDIRHGWRIARVELRRSLRKSFGTRKRQLALVGFVALFSPTLFFWVRTSYDAGVLAAERGTMSLGMLGLQTTLLVVAFVLMGVLRVVQQGRPDGDALLLTVTSTRAVLVGLTIHSTIQLVGFVLVPTLLFAGGFAVGAGYPTLVLTTILAVVPLFTAVTLFGTVAGQLAVLGLLKSHVLRSVSRGFGLVLLVVLMALGYAAMAPMLGATDSLAALSPLAVPAIDYLAFVFVGTPFGPGVGVGSVLVGALVVLSIPVLFGVADQLAPRLWFADATPTALFRRDDSVSHTTERVAIGSGSAPVSGPFPPRIGPRPVALALGLWSRWLRIPVRFTVLFPLVIVLVTLLVGTIEDPESLPLVIGGVLVFSAVYVAGAIFGLNPLGEAAEMRPVEMLSATSARTFVFGHAVAGLLVGAPLAVLGALLVAFTMTVPPLIAVLLGVLAIVLTVAGAGVGIGIGTVLPATDTQRTYRGYDVSTPSQWALVGYMFATMLLVGIAAVGSVFAILPVDGGGLSLLRVVAPIIAAIVLGLVGVVGYRTAIRRFASPVYATA